jgi:hypothetical protein
VTKVTKFFEVQVDLFDKWTDILVRVTIGPDDDGDPRVLIDRVVNATGNIERVEPGSLWANRLLAALLSDRDTELTESTFRVCRANRITDPGLWEAG